MPDNDYMFSGTLSLTFRMPPKQPHDVPDVPQATQTLNGRNGGASAFILISARCIGHLGFALSLFAIWFGWLLPASVQAPPEPAEVKPPRQLYKSPRRPPHATATTHAESTSESSSETPARPRPLPTRRVSAPVDLTPIPILATGAEDHSTPSRHVYFVDEPFAPIVRRNTMPEPSKFMCPMKAIHHACTTVIHNPSQPTPATYPHAAQPACECLDDTIPDSDSSRHSSRTSLLRPSSRLQKLKLGFNNKARSESAEKSADQNSLASVETASSDKSSRRSSGGGFASGWTLTRNRTSPDVTAESTPQPLTPLPLNSPCIFGRRVSPARSPATGSSVATEVLSPTFLSRKSQKRVSAPIPRTSPYGAPYFATPPIVLDNSYPTYLKNLPQFEDEMKAAPVITAADSDTEVVRGRTSGIRRVSLQPSPSPIAKRRSMSVDFTP